jgi:hypothetical protein
VIIGESPEALKECIDRFKESTEKWDLEISVRKTKVMSNEDVDKVKVDINGEEVKRVNEFVYLGSLLTVDGKSRSDINRRIRLAAFRYEQLRKSVWQQRAVSLKTKMRIYSAIILPTLLYGAESWTCGEEEYNRLNTFHTKRLRGIIGKKRDEISNKQLYKATNQLNIESVVRKYRLRWAGHVRRMEDERIAKRVLFGSLKEAGERRRGRPPLNWTKCLNADVERLGISVSRWVVEARERGVWKGMISSLTSI